MTGILIRNEESGDEYIVTKLLAEERESNETVEIEEGDLNGDVWVMVK